MKLYEQFSSEIKQQIEHGYYQPGQKLPSMRDMSAMRGVSISTVQEAYRLLEDTGMVISKPKSGYYVQAQRNPDLLPDISRPEQQPVEIVHWDEVLKLMYTESNHHFIALGSGLPNTKLKTLKPFHRIYTELSRQQPQRMLENMKGKGSLALREQITRVMQNSGCYLHPDDIVITHGCQEALAMSLKAVTEPGDIVAIDSPSFYGSMQAIQANGLKVIEIPTHPKTGISLSALELALEQWPIKVIQLIPNANNPLGYVMPDEKKHKLLELAAKYNFAIIEDDVFGELVFQKPRPSSIKSLDTEGRVLMCSSFSKTVAPGLRVGWVAAGRYVKRLTYLKFITTLGSAAMPQLTLTEFIQQGHYDKHVRNAKEHYQRGRDCMINWVQRYFPEGTKISDPQGGLSVWLALPEQINTMTLNENLQAHRIGIAPGALFSAKGKYKNCLRLTYANYQDPRTRDAVQTIGNEVKRMLAE